jgi:pimeloyl-ACP methyl ester carboxylesterase
MVNKIPNAILKVIQKCGHLSTLEQPDEVNRIIKDWWIKSEVRASK